MTNMQFHRDPNWQEQRVNWRPTLTVLAIILAGLALVYLTGGI